MTLTPQEKANCEKCFRQADKDGSGTLSIQELTRLFRSLGWDAKKYPDSEICDWFLDIDKDNTKSIDLNEFLMACDKRPRTEVNEANLRKTFKQFDADGSGSISASELKQALKKCEIHLNDAEAAAMIKQADVSGDGQIDVEEFLKLFAK